MRRLLAIVGTTIGASLLLSCGSSSPLPPKRNNAELATADAGTLVAEDAPSTSPVPPPGKAPSRLSTNDCQALIDHLFELIYQDRNQTLGDENRSTERPTEAARQDALATLRAKNMEACTGLARGAYNYDCAMAATTRTALNACESKVAPVSP